MEGLLYALVAGKKVIEKDVEEKLREKPELKKEVRESLEKLLKAMKSEVALAVFNVDELKGDLLMRFASGGEATI